MGSSSSRQMDGNELAQFRKLPLTPDNYELPERPENRRPTNRKWTLVFGIAILILFPFLIYTLAYSDGRRILHETDNCANICGYNNTKVDDVPCSGKDFTKQPYAVISITENSSPELITDQYCAATCPGGQKAVDNICFKNLGKIDRESLSGVVQGFQEVLDQLKVNWWRFILCVLITIGLSVGTLYLYRYATAVIVWSVLIFCTAVIVLLTIAAWYGYTQATYDKAAKQALVAAVFLTIFSIVIIALIAFLFKKIKLVILLYKEATKAVFAMPGLILLPVISAWAQVIVFILFLVTTIFMTTSGVLTKTGADRYEYMPNIVMIFSMVYNAVITLWASQFIVGCQYMVVSGSVAKYFFTRNKEHLDSPIMTSVSTTFNYHLGSISLGSFIITLTAVIKALIQSLIKNEKVRIFVQCCMDYIEGFLKWLSKNAYIEVAIHGQPFFKSGKRAARLLLTNAKSVIAVNSIGDFVLGMTQVLLVIITGAISYGILASDEHAIGLLILMIIFNIIVISITFGVFETTVDSLFICFCEDKVLNDGISKPYFMTRGLMEFVETSKMIYEKK